MYVLLLRAPLVTLTSKGVCMFMHLDVHWVIETVVYRTDV